MNPLMGFPFYNLDMMNSPLSYHLLEVFVGTLFDFLMPTMFNTFLGTSVVFVTYYHIKGLIN